MAIAFRGATARRQGFSRPGGLDICGHARTAREPALERLSDTAGSRYWLKRATKPPRGRIVNSIESLAETEPLFSLNVRSVAPSPINVIE
jgi:hypothetical protein